MEEKIIVVNSAIKALDSYKEHPELTAEEIIKKLIPEIKAEEDLKIACISAMSRALKYREQEKPRTKDKEIIDRIMKEADDILKSVEGEQSF